MHLDNPLVSIIIPNFNTEKYLSETIESVLAQTYKNWELLIIDDNSTDKSVEIIKSYSDKYDNVLFFQTEENSGGPATPRNIGLDNAKGELIAFLDSDDTWFPDKLKYQIKFMQRENCKFSSTFRNTFSEPQQIKMKLKENLRLKSYDFYDLLKKNLVDTSAVVIHKDLIGKIRFNTTPELVAIEDYDFWLRILKKHNENILVSEVETINYRITGSNISGSKLIMAKKFLRVVKNYNDSSLATFYYFLNYSILSLIYLVKKR